MVFFSRNDGCVNLGQRPACRAVGCRDQKADGAPWKGEIDFRFHNLGNSPMVLILFCFVVLFSLDYAVYCWLKNDNAWGWAEKLLMMLVLFPVLAVFHYCGFLCLNSVIGGY